ncbi:MAG: dihydroorotase [Bacteroidales bacterium]|jgi:dihydroorotase|nr:dihydroorotase [Bacteroidales bacterium]
MYVFIKNGQIINEGKQYKSDILIKNEIIVKIGENIEKPENCEEFDAEGMIILPGIIDTHVHFREPGLTEKANIFSDSRAAAAGGITSFIDMPNTIPPTLSIENLNVKFEIAKQNSIINYSFFLGAGNNNLNEILNVNPNEIAGIKIFMGASTGNMCVNNPEFLEEIFKQSKILIAVHCEDDEIIKNNLLKYKRIYGEKIPIKFHSKIRSEEACLKSTMFAVKLAEKYNSKLHILHISTEKEINLLNNRLLGQKNLSTETCVNYLWFSENDYKKFGTKIKCNPAIKTEKDRLALIKSLKTGKIDTIATDHAPHTLEEKNNNYCEAPSGIPSIQHSLQMMIDLFQKGYFSLPEIVKFMCHNPADLFQIEKRGYLKENYFADIAIIKLNEAHEVNKSNIFYKCKWSPLENYIFNSKIIATFVNGKKVFNNNKIIETKNTKQLKFNRI